MSLKTENNTRTLMSRGELKFYNKKTETIRSFENVKHE